jgi:voltage-gated potassium channel
MSLRSKLNIIIFGTHTPAGKAFDIGLLFAIILSIIIVMLESVPSIDASYDALFKKIEWILTVAFTLEYLIRIYVTENKSKYIFSFYGIIDFLSILPTYLSLMFTGGSYLLVIRALRLLRVFRILKLSRFLGESEQLVSAIKSSRHKITVFMGAVITLVLILGTLMYLVEGGGGGFTSIPRSVYWAIVTLTTVGYGDITPQTVIGQFISSLVMILGYAIIAVPTGIVTAELTKKPHLQKGIKCEKCQMMIHEADALYCKYCGERLSE